MQIKKVEVCPLITCHACIKRPATIEVELNRRTSLSLCSGCFAELLTLRLSARGANQDDELTRILKAVERMYDAEYRHGADEMAYDKERREAFVGVLRAWDEMLG